MLGFRSSRTAATGRCPGPFTGAGPIGEVLARHPRLRLVIAHAGMPRYADFLDLAARYPSVMLDTTMAFTDFTEATAPFPRERLPELRDLGLAGRVLLGSDFPTIPYGYEHQIDALVRLDLGDDWLRQVLWTAPWRAARAVQPRDDGPAPTARTRRRRAADAGPTVRSSRPIWPTSAGPCSTSAPDSPASSSRPGHSRRPTCRCSDWCAIWRRSSGPGFASGREVSSWRRCTTQRLGENVDFDDLDPAEAEAAVARLQGEWRRCRRGRRRNGVRRHLRPPRPARSPCG